MLISSQQLAANHRNSERSTGPSSPEGKAAVRFNALKYGLRAQSMFLPGEDSAAYEQLWSDLEADWHPRNRTERLCLEQMAAAQWMLARLARYELRAYAYEVELELSPFMALLERFSTQRARLEHSFAAALRDLERLQQKHAIEIQPSTPQTLERSAPKPVPPPAYVKAEPYVMSEPSAPQALALSCAPDTR